MNRRQFLRLGAASSFVLASGYAFGREVFQETRVVRYAFVPPNWTPGLKLRVAVVSDIHSSEPWMPAESIDEIVRRTNELKPDIVILPGDYVRGRQISGSDVPPKVWARSLSRLQAPLGVHSVIGNHDFFDDDWQVLHGSGRPLVREALVEHGLGFLSNEVRTLEKDGIPFVVAGLGTQYGYSIVDGRRRRGTDDLPGVLSKIPDGPPVLLIAHEPDIFVDVPDRISLTISGHTHGGQIRLFGWTPIVPSAYGSRFVYGHIVEDGRHLVVSGGLGCSGVPVRVASPPEIVVLDLGGDAVA